MDTLLFFWVQLLTGWKLSVQVNLCKKLLFLHQLTHNMTTDCSLNYKFNTWKFQAQNMGEHAVYRICFWHSERFLYTTCSPHVLQKEVLLTKIYLYPVRTVLPKRPINQAHQGWKKQGTCTKTKSLQFQYIYRGNYIGILHGLETRFCMIYVCRQKKIKYLLNVLVL